MDRIHKGKCVQKYISDYTIVDLETTGIYVGSAKIIEISAIKVRNNEVAGEFSTLINPLCHIPEEATAVNHITDEMVADAPKLSEVIDEFFEFIGNDVIVGYNNAAFDMNILYDERERLRNSYFTNDYIDILHSARKCLVELENCKLETVSKHYGLDTEGEHRALKDCYLTKDCYDKLYNEFGNEAFQRESRHSYSGTVNRKKNELSNETEALRELQLFLETIIEDGKVTEEEFYSLKEWVEKHRDLHGIYPFDRVFDSLDKVLEDGIVSQQELDELQVLFEEYVDPVEQLSVNDIETISNKQICVTGDFCYGNRKEVEDLIISLGGIIDKNVKKSTDFIIVGSYGSEKWKTGNYGGKILKALEFNQKGAEIRIIKEKSFFSNIDILKENATVQEENNKVDWKEKIQAMLEDLITELELPEHSLYLKENIGSVTNKITSYTVSIFEPEFPPSKNKERITNNQVVMNIKEKKQKLELIIPILQFGDIELPKNVEVNYLKSDKANAHVIIEMDNSSLSDYIRKNTKYVLARYESKVAPFGCCNRFNECSDAKKCVHENKLYSKACMYRNHLDNGRIFYGKNRNID